MAMFESGIIINTLPHPKKAINLADVSFLSNRGFYIPKPLTENGIELVYLFFVIGIIFSILFYKHAKKKQDLTLTFCLFIALKTKQL